MITGVKKTKSTMLGIGVLCLAALPAFGDVPSGQNNNQSYPDPGTLNYVQGSAYLQGQQLNDDRLGNSEMAPGQVLRTTEGKAEVLLTPGVFLRLGDHSVVRMISPDIANTKVQVLKGEAGVEVDEIHPQNNLQIVDNGVTTRLLKRGFYEFLANPARVLVFSGKAQVERGDGRVRNVNKHRQMALEVGVRERPHGFNMKNSEDSLYNWSKLRSQYLAEANDQYMNEYGYAGYPGWYWNPWGLWDWGGPGWGWGGWGPGFGWGPGWGWGGFWGGPIGYYRPLPGRGYMHHGGDLHGGVRGGGSHGEGAPRGMAFHGGGMAFHGGGMAFHGGGMGRGR